MTRIPSFPILWIAWALFRLASVADGADDAFLRKECTRKLRILFEALQAFRRAEGDYPTNLSELHPRFVDDLALLSCPAALESRNFAFGIREFRNALKEDLSTSYNYELSSTITWKDPATSSSLTHREFKALQRKTPVGDRVPIVRCCNHPGENSCLNLSFAGNVYSGPAFWEVGFRDVLPHPYLIPESVHRDTRAIALRVPPRPSSVSKQQLDLTRFYNGCIQDLWLWGKKDGPLSELLSTATLGPISLGGTVFDIRGIIQLDATPVGKGEAGFPVPMFPEAVRGIPVGRNVHELNFLLGVAFPEKHGTQVGSIQVQVAGGNSLHIPVYYGTDAEDLLVPGTIARSPGLKPAWQNSNSGGRLFIKHWTNPRPELEITSIDVSSSMSHSAPFFVAISIDP